MIIGYARISTSDQTHDLQLDALSKVGCERIFTDTISGTVTMRSGLEKAKAMLKTGDTLIVWRLDRLGRSLKDLIDWMSYFDSNGIALKSLQERIDTSTAAGKLIFHVFSALAEFERNLIVERVNAGLTAARERGRIGGRKEKVFEPSDIAEMKTLHTEGVKIDSICRKFSISKPTLYKIIKQNSFTI